MGSGKRLGPGQGMSEHARRYPPLLVIVVALALALFALPSALNLPLANPGQTLEYAPVPGNQSSTPPQGNFAGLGLGSSNTGASAGGGSSIPPNAALAQQLNGLGAVISNKQCVGNPPRQTEDPLSPPCVAYYKGDNGGATHTGVTATEVTVLFRFTQSSNASCTINTSSPNPCGPPNGYYDMNNANHVSQYYAFRYLRDWEMYFNVRYQFYNRSMHFWAYNDGGNPQDQYAYTADNARSDAADNWNHLHPFAVLDESGVYSQDYTTYMAQHGVVDFGGLGFSQQLASSYPGLFWSFPPSLDRMAQEYASFVCTRIIAPGRVSFSGDGDIGNQRVYGLLLTDDPLATIDQQRQQLAVKYLKQDCNFDPAYTAYFHYAGGNDTGPRSGWGTQNMAAMRVHGVTTIIWPGGGSEVEDTKAASNAKYYPEWMLLGDDLIDGTETAQQQATDEFSHAWIITRQPLTNYHDRAIEAPCYDALESVDPTIDRATADMQYACDYYDDIRQMSTGIQLAGPRLTPQTMDQGFHAIPARPSTSPYEPSCYYLPDDYTCVKDGAAEWFDEQAKASATSSAGLWRMWENGQRFLPGQWPSGDIMTGWDPNDVVNLFDPGQFDHVRAD